MNQYQDKNIFASTLYIVPTPIGNINDISQRAISTLQKVDIIAAEDTRKTGLLLHYFNIHVKLCSLHEHNEYNKTSLLLNKLKQGNNIALVSDAGTPLINDPGYYLIRQCRNIGVRIVPLPGPCAAITALSASGLPANRFCYEGFLPTKCNSRKNYLQKIAQEPRTLIFYESRHRVLESLQDMYVIWGNSRYIVLAKELTKKWETILGGSAEELIKWIQSNQIHQRGEIVLVVEGCTTKNTNIPISKILHTFSLLKEELSFNKAISYTAKICNIRKNIIYRYIIEYNTKLNTK